MALVTVLKPSIVIVSPHLLLGPTITLLGFKTVTSAIKDHAPLKHSVIVILGLYFLLLPELPGLPSLPVLPGLLKK